MSWPLRAHLVKWSAWAPGLTTPDDWRRWAQQTTTLPTDGTPSVDFIPAMQRRRLSRLSKLALRAAQDCAGDAQHNLPTVFASRHGEIHRTLGLLQSLAAAEPLSPTAFSLSVHNTASGLYAIHQGNTAASTAIAAGRDSLPMAWVEAVGLLRHHPDVMLVYAEEPLPDTYNAFIDQPEYPLGLALHLRAEGDNTIALDSTEAPATQVSGGLPWLAWLARSDAEALHVDGERQTWRWSRT